VTCCRSTSSGRPHCTTLCAHPNYPVFGAIVRENRKRCDALARQRAEISARADQQHNSVMQGNDRGIYGPQGAELIHCIYLAGVPTGPGRRGAHPPMAHGPLRNPIRELTTLRQATKQRFGRYSPANRLTADVSGAVCANRVGAGDGSPSPSIAYPGVIGLSPAPGNDLDALEVSGDLRSDPEPLVGGSEDASRIQFAPDIPFVVGTHAEVGPGSYGVVPEEFPPAALGLLGLAAGSREILPELLVGGVQLWQRIKTLKL
jgi:hypothetical protein